MLAKFQYHTNVPLGVCDRDTEIVSSSTKNRGLADSETLNIPNSPCFPYYAKKTTDCRAAERVGELEENVRSVKTNLKI